MDFNFLTQPEVDSLSKEELWEGYVSLAASYKKREYYLGDIDKRFEKQQKDYDKAKKALKEAQETITKLCNTLYGLNVLWGKKEREKLEIIWKNKDKAKNSIVAKAQRLVEVIQEIFDEIKEEPIEYNSHSHSEGGNKGAKEKDAKADAPVEGEQDAEKVETEEKDAKADAPVEGEQDAEKVGTEEKDAKQTDSPATGDPAVAPDPKEQKQEPSAQTIDEAKEAENGEQKRDSSVGAPCSDMEDEGGKGEEKPSEGQAKGDCGSTATEQETPNSATDGTGTTSDAGPGKQGSNNPNDLNPENGANGQAGQQNPNSSANGEQDSSSGKSPLQGDEKPKKGKGNKNLTRTSGFINNSFIDVGNLIVEIDPIYWGLPDVMKQLNTDDIEKIRLSADVQTYLNGRVIDGRIYPVLHISLKFRNGENVYRNPHNGRIFRSSICADDVIATIASYKYNLGLPLNRLEDHMLKHMNLNLHRATIENWIRQVYERGLKIFKFAMLDYLISQEVLILDETYIDCKELDGNCFYWGICTTNLDPDSLPVCLFIFDESRSVLVPNHYLSGFHGTILTDGYGVYPAFAEGQGANVTLASCWKHWRTYLKECLLSKDQELKYEKINGEPHWSLKAWKLVSEMYVKEREYHTLSPEERLKKRLEETYPKACEIESILKDAKANDLNYQRFETTTKAIDYFFNRRDGLFRIFEDGRIPMSTNELETRNCTVALGRVNWIAVETPLGGEISGTLFSMTATARMARLDVIRYFNFVLESIPHILNMYTDEQLKEIEDYYDEFMEVLAKSHEGKSKKENKLFHPEKMVHKKPDLSLFNVLLPNSPEQKAYFLLAEKEEEERHAVISQALSLHSLSKSPITDQQMLLILNTLQDRIKKGNLPQAYEKAINALQQAVKDKIQLHPLTANQLVDYIDTLLPNENDSEEEKERKGKLLSEENLQAFCDIKKYIQEKWYKEVPAEDIYSTANFTYPDNDIPEYLVNPTDILERYEKHDQPDSAREASADNASECTSGQSVPDKVSTNDVNESSPVQASSETGNMSTPDTSKTSDSDENTYVDPSSSASSEATDPNSRETAETSSTDTESPAESDATNNSSECTQSETDSETGTVTRAGSFSGKDAIIPLGTTGFDQESPATTVIEPSSSEQGQGIDSATEEEKGKPPP